MWLPSDGLAVEIALGIKNKKYRLATKEEKNRTLICCWPSPAQPFFVSGPAGTHDHIFVRSKTLKRVF
jgi:hypothetical protein